MNNTALSSLAESVWSMPTASQGSMFNRLDPKNMFNRLPDEIVVHICCYLDCYSLLKFGRCRCTIYIMLQIYLSQFSILTRTSWLNCALRGDDAKKGKECAESAGIVQTVQRREYWMVLGGTGSIQGDTG